MLALLECGVVVEKYVAYEIDKYAVKTSSHNFPLIEHEGDVFKADFTQYKGFDILCGGSPCTYWSIAQTKNRETVASGMGWELFSQYVRALREAQPKYFFYENNKSMSAEIRNSITQTFGFEPICINSALVSAQNRQRLYWVGIRQNDGTYRKAKIEQPEDKGILLKDILETNSVSWLNKSHTIDATYYKGGSFEGDRVHQNASRLMAAVPIFTTSDGKAPTMTTRVDGANIKHVLEHGINTMVAEPINTADNGKARTLIASYGAKQGLLNTIGASGFGCTGVAEQIRPLSDAEMDYIVRNPERRFVHINKPGEEDKSKCVIANYAKGVPYNICAEPIPFNPTEEGKAHTLTASYYKISEIPISEFGNENARPRVAIPVCVASRGRNPENPSSRIAGEDLEQRYEAREDGKTNTLTTVSKDNMVAEPIRVGTMPSPDGEIKNGQGMRVYSADGKAVPITTGQTKTGFYAEPIRVGSMPTSNGEVNNSQSSRIYSTEGKSVTLNGCAGGDGAKTGLYAEQIPECFRVKEATTQGYTDIKPGDCVDMSMPNSKTRRGRNMEDKSNCLQTTCAFFQYCGTVKTPIYEVKDGKITVKGKQYPIKLIDGFYIIRKLTVLECMRLQTVPEWYDFSCVSNSQAYKMLGNGWTVSVIAHLMQSAFADKCEVIHKEPTLDDQLDIFDVWGSNP